jgi:Tol biopolymer transport system component
MADSDDLVYFSPDGARTLLGSPVSNGIDLVDFATGNGRALASGHAPVWSPDARHLAFSLTVFSQDGQTIDDAFAVNVDGTDQHALTSTSTPDVHYAPADWSPDSRGCW